MANEAFQNPTSKKRIAKMIEYVDMLDKSALNNNATPEDWAELLRPILNVLHNRIPQAVENNQHIGDVKEEGATKLLNEQRVPGYLRYGTRPDVVLKALLEDLSLSELQPILYSYVQKVDEEFCK